MDFLNFRRFEQGNLSTTPVADRRIQNINDENQLNMGTPQRMMLDFHQVSPVHPSTHGKSALLSGARRILPSNKPVETKNVSAVTPSAKHERNHYMKPTEAFQHAVEDVSSTPLRGKKSSHSHRTPASANTPSTLHKTFKKSKPSVTPATAVPTAMEHSAQKDRKNHYENELLLHNDALHTPVRQKSPSRRVQRSESTPPARPRMQAREQVSHRSGRKDSSASVVSGKSIPSYMEPTVTHSAKKVIKQPKEEHTVASHSEAILFSPQSLLRRSNSASRLDALLGSSERPLERPVSAPKPRPSPFSFALHTEETKEHAKMEMFRSPPPAIVPAVVTPDVELAPPLSAQKSVRSAKKATPVGTSGFTAEQLSAYKARKRAILAVGSANANGNKSSASARYAAPTVSAFIRAKEVQVSKKAVVTPPTSNVVNNKLKTNSNENLTARFSSPTRRAEPFAVPQVENSNNITKKGHGDRFASPSLIRERMMKEHNRVKDVRPDIIEEKNKKIDAAKLLQLVDAVEKSVILETSQSSPSKSSKYNNKVKREFDELSHSSSKLDHHGMSTLTPSHDSKTSQNLTQINNYDILFESYNESSNILNMSIDESENNKVIRNLQQTNVSQKIEIKSQRSFEGDISSVLPSGTGMSVGGFHQHELLDEVSFQESMDFSSNTLKHLMAPLKQVENITTSMEQTSMMKESDSMNDIIEESKRLMEENKRVIQTVQERMIKFDNANNANNTAHPVGTPQVSANTNSTSSKITLDAMNLSAIEPTSTSPHSFSIGSISTFGEMSAHRRTFSPIKELLRKPSLGGAPSSGPSINTAPLPPSIALPNMSRKRSTSIEQQPTPRDVLNLSVISRSNSVHCLPTPTSFGGTFSRSETPLMMFESSNAMGGKITPQPVGVSLVRSTSTGANLAEVNNAWATEYINMLQESTKSASITPAVQFPLDRTAVRSSKDSGSVAGIDHRKFSITDSEVEYINSNQNSQQNHSSSTLMDDSGGNDSSNPLNIAMIRSGNSSLAIFSTSAGPSTITLPIANEDGEPFTPLSVSSPLPPPSMTNTTQSTSSAVPPMILMPSTSLTNPISLMDIRMSHGENKENMSPLGIVAGMSGSRSPFFPSGVTVRTPLQTIKEERGIVSIAMNSSSVEEENENDENQPPLSQLENGSAVVTSEGVSSSEVELENNTVDNATTQGTSLNEAFLKDSLVTMTSNPSNNSEVASEMMMISASAMHQNDSNGVAETRSRLFSTTAFDLTITPSKIHQDSHDDEVSVEESDNEEEEEGENEQEDENNDVVLPKQVNTSFELEPRKLSTIPSMIPTTSHHNLPMPLFPTTHHVKALDYESIEKMSIGRSTSMSSGRGSGQRSIGSSVTRSTNRRSPAPITMTAETDLSLPMSVALPTILPSVPIPPLHNNYLRDQEEEDGLVMDDSRRLVDRIEMSDDVVNVQDDESDEEVVDDEANENEERIKEEIVEEEHQHEEMMSSSLPYVNDDDDSSMIEMNGSLHSFDANVLLSMSNRSMELPLPSPITTVYQRKTVAPIPSNITEGSERSKISDDGEDAVIGGDVISELIKGICEVESTLTKAEQSSEGKKSSETSGRSSPVKMRRMMMMAPSMKLLTPTTSDYSLNNSNTAPISISSHPFPASYPTKPAVELSAISSEGMVDRSSTSYTSSVDELATYNTMSLPSLAVDAMMNNIPIRRGSFPSNAVLPPQIQMTPSTSFLPDEVDEDEMDIDSVRLLTHREEMNPALAPSPHTKRLSTIISPDPVASQLMLNNRRHINDRNIKMMEQTFMTVNDLNNSR